MAEGDGKRGVEEDVKRDPDRKETERRKWGGKEDSDRRRKRK